MATASPDQSDDDDDEKATQLMDELQAMAEIKAEKTRKLYKIFERESQKQDQLRQIIAEKLEREQTKGSDLQAKLESLQLENSQLKRHVVSKAEDEPYLEALKASLQRIMSLSETQRKETKTKEKENTKLSRRIKCLEDEISAAQRIAAETQLRQLNELQTLTKENEELKQKLTELCQQPATEEDHHPGRTKYLIVLFMLVWLL